MFQTLNFDLKDFSFDMLILLNFNFPSIPISDVNITGALYYSIIIYSYLFFESNITSNMAQQVILGEALGHITFDIRRVKTNPTNVAKIV